ncbi:hypothetical protein JCM3770_006664 [Rhodotorula araucariae]
MHQPDRTLVLAFPSLDPFIAGSSHLARVHAAATKTKSALLVLVRTPPAAPSPWAPAPPGALSAPSTAPPPRPALSPTSLFLPLEQALARVYAAATTAFLATDDGPLKSVDVVIEQIRGVAPICLPDDGHGTVDRWEWIATDDDDTWERTMGKGKGKAELNAPPAITPTQDTALPPIYPVVALGGTFDHLHAGHKILLTMACSLCTTRLIVGVSDDALLVNKKFRHLLQPLEERIRAVVRFVALVRPSITCDAVPLQDVYGPTAHDPTVEALVVSDETRAGGDSINALRLSRSLNRLTVFTISLVAHDGTTGETVEVEVATKMGSTGIREWLDQRARERGSGGAA